MTKRKKEEQPFLLVKPVRGGHKWKIPISSCPVRKIPTEEDIIAAQKAVADYRVQIRTEKEERSTIQE